MNKTNQIKISEEMNVAACTLAKDMLEHKCAWANRIGVLRKKQLKELRFEGKPKSRFYEVCPNGLMFPMEHVEYIWSMVCKGDVALTHDDGLCFVHWLKRVEDLETDEQIHSVFFLAKCIYDNYGNKAVMDEIRAYISQPPMRRSFSQTPFRYFVDWEGRDISYPKSIIKKIVSAIDNKKLSFTDLEDGNVSIDSDLDFCYLVEDLWKKVA